MKTISSLEEAKLYFVEKETALHRAIAIALSTQGTQTFQLARDNLQRRIVEYTDACRVWGAIDGIVATQQLHENETEFSAALPIYAEMH